MSSEEIGQGVRRLRILRIRRVLDRGHTSIRDPMKFSGELSIGHRSFSLGE